MLTQVIRLLFQTYGYKFLATEDLLNTQGRVYASLSIVEDDESDRKLLCKYLLAESPYTQVLRRENLEEIIESCRTLLDHQAWSGSSEVD